MRGIAFALVALTFAATTPHPAAAQCYGPECDPRRSNAPAYFNERPNFQSQPGNGQPYRPAPYEQGQPYRQPQYQGQPYQGQPYQQAPYQQGQQYQQMPQSQPPYQRPGYQAPGYQGQPRPPTGYSNVPPGMNPGMAPGMNPGMTPRGPGYQPGVQTRVTKISKPSKSAARPHQPAPNSRTVVRSGQRPAGAGQVAGQVTISVAEYRDLQNQARELQRLMSTRGGAPNRGPSPFPDVRPQGGAPGQ